MRLDDLVTGSDGGRGMDTCASGGDQPAEGASLGPEAPSPMELSGMPLDPIYGWGIVLEPVEVLIERTSDFVVQLAEETHRRGEPFSDDELEQRFLAFFERLVDEGTLERLPDAPPEMGRQILGPRRWVEAQRIRIQRLVEHWEEKGLSSAPRG